LRGYGGQDGWQAIFFKEITLVPDIFQCLNKAKTRIFARGLSIGYREPITFITNGLPYCRSGKSRSLGAENNNLFINIL